MTNLEKEIKTFVSEYHHANHEKGKIKAHDLIKKYPQEIKLLKVIGVLFVQNKKIDDAITIFRKILDVDPLSVDILINIGVAYFELNKLDLALEYLNKAKNLNNRQDEIYFNLGVIYAKRKKSTEAILSYEQSIKYNPNNRDALINLGSIYLVNEDYHKAKKIFKKAINLQPDDSRLYHNLGVVLTRLDNFEEAIGSYVKAQKLNSKNPLTYYNLGYLLTKKFKIKESINNYKEAIKLDSNNEKFYYNLALTETELGKYFSAITNYRRAISIFNDYEAAKYNLARLNLATENFSDGWKDYEKRHNQNNIPQRIKNVLNFRQWNGKKFDGTLYVHGEQGIGDLILHSSMILDLYKIQNNICLSVDDRLVSLFRRSFKKINIVGYNTVINYTQNDCHIPLASLGSFLRKSINDFPKIPKSYILPSFEKVNYFKKVLPKNKKIKIGLSWRTIGDRNSMRSISLEQMSKLLTLKDIDFINLQYGDSFEERKLFKEKFLTEIIDFDTIDLTNDFEKLSALIKSCDLIITISNVTAHFAGAIGKKTWVIVPLYTQWHWFYERINSIWYPNVKLFRQKDYGSWDNIIDIMHNAILNIKNG